MISSLRITMAVWNNHEFMLIYQTNVYVVSKVLLITV